ncbi:hypothetical protein BO70DRAFT_389335 [Aspergillus heteromorphus CBS 117.55]|uniref:Rhodopsin domain-containing protein n=1 Tax=Aspergillus heteromorphus CBS 117.55 TaxID=1448321 RepID=A0A317VJN2_9EURO|nr:uncharacterized protein BO70DRAFT_389335 [Aspergillus heteromorphus CBS 117.55]PWY73062.1 hypothetical protein BO70DRAFT_389335 [Aspergillus heteromorphus CBS 117.55]
MTVDPAIVAVFGQPPAGIDLADSRVAQDNRAVIALICLCVITVILRFVARLGLRNPLMLDDWLIVAALVFVCATAGLSMAGGAFGAGRHVWAITLPELTQIFKILFAYTFVYAASCSTCKLSILFFYRRVFVTSHQDLSLRVSLLVGFGLTLSYPIIVWVTMGNCCRPVSYFWNEFSGATGTCIDTDTFFLAAGVVNMVNDIVVLLIPFPRIAKLQMHFRKKVAICAILALGSFVCVASAVRIYVLYQFIQGVDVTWMMGPVFIWSSIEPAVAIVCACLPHMAPLARAAHIRFLSSRDSKSGRPSYPSMPWRSGSEADAHPLPDRCSRFNKGRLPSCRPEDEIGLTSQVAGHLPPASVASSSKDHFPGHSIVVHSTVEQTVSDR